MTPDVFNKGVKDRIRKIYRRQGERGQSKLSLGEEIRREVIKKRRAKPKKVPHDIELWLSFLDEMLGFWLFVWALYRQEVEEEKPSRVSSICLMTLAGRVFNDLVCVHDLISSGFFVQSNAIARSTIEEIDVMQLLNLEPDLAQNFRATEGNETAARFWHTYCSRNKIHRKVKERWIWLFKGEESSAEAFHKLRLNYLDLMGMSVHPSFSACFVTFMDTADGEPSDSIIDTAFGEVSKMSKFTIHLLLYRIFEYGFLWILPMVSSRKKENKIDKELYESVTKAFSVIFSIFTTVDEDRGLKNDPFFPEFRTYWQRADWPR